VADDSTVASAVDGAGEPAEGGLLAETQRRLMDYYRLASIPPIQGFVRPTAAPSRERLWVRQSADLLELALELPGVALSLPATALDAPRPGDLDCLCQAVEGVSHFVLLAHRAKRERPTTELELELQGELDKYLMLAVAPLRPLPHRQRRALRARLFLQVRFCHPSSSVRGFRYRYAHRLAWRLTRRFERRYLREARHAELRAELRRLYRVGQEDKIAAALAA
jgi:hypothetical protein